MREFKCASCGEIFQVEKGEFRCPKCGSRTLILLKGETLRRKGGSGGGCSTCSTGTCSTCGI
ncbi:MAG: hypothetical protein H5T91_01415 [Synergistetes bacterium]|nr:hypothetical protein [Synergistota bacterium]